MTLRTALIQGTELLESAGIAVPRLTAEVLLGHAIHCERVYFYAHPEQELKEVEWIHYGRYLHERLNGKPTQYITQRQEFYGREFRVTPAVLIPRPETEHVVEVALETARGARRILDVGTGSGALAVTLRLETGAEVCATDISADAARVAAGNAARLGGGVSVVVCDLMEAIAARSCDLIVSNPPYVPLTQKEGLQREVRDFEPHVALFGGETGYELYDRIANDAQRVLRSEGWLIMELGFGCHEHVERLLAGWRNVKIAPDLAGIPRVAAAQLR
ncbi:MAG TPA: peptide chain release factor N(5)-glutamine methyltransferase [Candidatus Sulfopaludibacter sp.]|jgi:release factor glutamine methyltransferase|nr:peptide chain release factor N(5)-glutamine methyltransferase [Candidatus Sulfopaludibacter sp.]